VPANSSRWPDAQDAAASLALLDQVISSGHALESLVLSLMEHLRGLMLLRICGPQTELVDAPEALRARMLEQAKAFSEPTYVFMLSLLEELRRSVRYSGTGRALVDAVIVRLCMLDAFTSLQVLSGNLGPAASASRGAAAAASAPGAGRTEGRNSIGSPVGRPLAEPPARPVSPPKKVDSPSSAKVAEAGEMADAPVPPPQARSMQPVAASARIQPRSAPLPSRPISRSDVLNSSNPDAVPPARTSFVRGTSSQDIRKVTGDPLVRRAIDLFEGTLVGVRPANPSVPDASAGRPETRDQAEYTPEPEESSSDDAD